MQLFHDLQPFLVVFLGVLVAGGGYAMKGWMSDLTSSFTLRFDVLSKEIVVNREAAQTRDAEHGKELAMLSEALRGLKEALERYASSSDSLANRMERLTYQQGKQEERVSGLVERVVRMERRCDVSLANIDQQHRRSTD